MQKQTYMRLARTLHVYLTMFSSVVLFFFASTGFMMNHESWFGLKSGHGKPPQPPSTQRRDEEPLVERPTTQAPGELQSASMRAVGTETRAGRPRPEGGLLAKLTALHKGKPPSLGATLLIDCTALVLMLASVTGIALLVSLSRRRRLGLTLMGVGTLAALLIFLFAAH